jgi:hypothetical protein
MAPRRDPSLRQTPSFYHPQPQRFEGMLCIFSPIFLFFYLDLPLAAFSSLDLPLLAKVPRGGFGGISGRPARAAWAGWSRQRLPPSSAAMADKLPEGKWTVPTSLTLEDLTIGSNFCQGIVEEKAE